MRWKRSCDEQALKTGIHAHLGLITIIIYFWTLTFVIRRPFEACALTMIYMLCFLAVLLTPALYGVVKNVYRERSKDIKSSMSLSAFREQIQSRPITVESRSGPLRTIQSRASEASRQSMSLDLEIFVRRK
uniref:Uncharacterized protein n=1 Tax=Glossina brevipalpis TaxID=37001 RepID=A0A1A9VZV2_9MUSC